ncbi:beta-1,3-galactosyl-O-glycosyl-glycoprotein beta-1,6-N-acetylglucosaminyltransferase 7-like [Spea bombifrons]|uniref:beta-1,3-galactosyl-O-glycosyl-glycoprotein beta-1,6-N-acetylglucosaminyltransferase 7-like n=1 Tax=Spea bombifrons TaxID=233779 RepID=UPI00234A1C7C|nr:beta-1,3-galactosyl-O-glycosyl-glycoprotein beta-1,6-N-acetylglucosaminyltransferase 7-like [Spea bombifrons]
MCRLATSKSGIASCIVICGVFFTFYWIEDFQNQKYFPPEIKECGFYPGELCGALFEGKPAALAVGNICQASLPPSRDQSPARLSTKSNCSTITKELKFITRPLSGEEEDYPLAYILTIHKQLDMSVKLLRAVYAPQNIYCIHVDKKSSRDFSRAVRKLAGCFQNIIVPAKQESVVYAGISRLRADIHCMEELLAADTPWRHVINLCGQDFPIKTNREIIRYLKSKWNGRNLTPGVLQPPHMKYRTRVSYREFIHQGRAYVYPSSDLKSAPPHNMTLFFGTAYYALTRHFVEFVLSDERAADLLRWSADTYSPDEHYWVTLNRLKDAPGSTPNAQWEGNIRAIKWRDQEGRTHTGCHGHYVRDICVYGLGDLQWITESPHLFANKFDPRAYPLVTDCLERHFRLKVLRQSEVPIDPDWYLEEDDVKPAKT